MKYLRFLTLTFIGFASSISMAQENNAMRYKEKIKVSKCGFDYDDETYFCQPKQKQIFENSLKKPIDFNKAYTVIKIKDHDYYRIALLNHKNKTVYPLYQQVAINKKLKFEYSINSPRLCIFGDFEAYRDSYEDTQICFKQVGDNIETDTITPLSD